ncbi:minor capsid protein [Leptotrichia wadei]|uniref:minor capsid protein n=1 Tax=Leptotrichia wadei TaxID=157687 RepID=UPI0011BD5F4B|nr:minor capsid protein [Leptotrichia wadei]
MSASKSNVARLVYTESAAYASKARIKTYEDLNVERYEVVATLDSRTSEICQSIDGKVLSLRIMKLVQLLHHFTSTAGQLQLHILKMRKKENVLQGIKMEKLITYLLI